jgi:hypothetical protein
MTNASLLTADRATHLKIVVLSLLCAILIAGIGIASRVSESAADSGMASSVIKPAKPLTAAGGEDRTIR